MKYYLVCFVLSFVQFSMIAQISSRDYKKKDKEFIKYQESDWYKNLAENIDENSKELKKYTAGLHGEFSEEYLIILDNIALVYENQFNYPKVLELRLEQSEKAKKVYKIDSYESLLIENKLAFIYHYLNPEKAKELYEKIEPKLLKITGFKDATFLSLMHNLSNVYSYLREYSSAYMIYLKMGPHYKSFYGENSRAYLKHLRNLAELYIKIGYSKKSIELNLEVLEKTKKNFGEEDPDYILSLNNLAIAYLNEDKFGDLKKPLFYLLESNKHSKLYLSKFSPHYGTTLENLSYYYQIVGDKFNALKYRLEYLNIERDRYLLYEQSLNKNNRNSLYNRIFLGYSQLLGAGEYVGLINSVNYSEDIIYQKLNLQIYDFLCFLKGREVSKANLITSLVYSSNDQYLIADYERWNNTNKQIASYYELPLKTIDSLNIDMDSLIDISAKLEREVLKSINFNAEFNKDYNFNDIRNRLSGDEIYIDIVKVEIPLTENIDGDYLEEYFAFIIKSDINYPIIENLSISLDAGDDESVYASFRRAILNKNIKDNNSYLSFFEDLIPYFDSISTIYFSPDGVYSKINPNVLYDVSSKNYLLNKYNIININCPEDFICIKDKKNNNNSNNIVLVGNPKFLLNNKELKENLAFNVSISRSYADVSHSFNYERGVNIIQLPGAANEINNISNILTSADWDIELISYNNATEYKIKNINAPRVLHIATHGYFLPKDLLIKTKAIGSIDAVGPLMRSGLLFAGAQNTSNGEDIGIENGWLNSYEASFLNLRGTELVVLSACETGMGEVKNGKGVFGLQRAIKIAGAESIIMSMWKVDDVATQKLMTYFYEYWIKDKLSKRKALTKAQNELKKEYPAPYYWGAFVMIGR
tara:strand:- start:262 stop:2880 length:2619 start_codon:yes stop_codon:yes gene_type:complete